MLASFILGNAVVGGFLVMTAAPIFQALLSFRSMNCSASRC